MAIEIDGAIDRLLRAMTAKGFPFTVDSIGDDRLAELRAAIAPLRLPSDVEVAWRRLPVWAGAFLDSLDLQPAPAALKQWQEEADIFPRCLFPIGYASRSVCWIELHGPDDSEGGAVWSGHYEIAEIGRVAPSIAELLDASAEAWDAGIIRWSQWQGRAVAVLEESDAWAALRARRWPSPPTADLAARLRWPARWLRLSGLEPIAVNPRGATSTVREIEAVVATGRMTTAAMTLAGRIRGGFFMAAGSRTTFVDGTGAIEIWIPATVDPFRLAGRGQDVELDVVIQLPARRPAPSIETVHDLALDALGGPVHPDSALVQALKDAADPSTIAVIATAVRRAVATD
jgi:hypothetical protein